MKKGQWKLCIGHLTWQNFQSAVTLIPASMSETYNDRFVGYSWGKVWFFDYPDGLYAGVQNEQVWKLNGPQSDKVRRILELINED